jgi:hypothetical protein
MSNRAWLSLVCFAPPSWGVVFGPLWAVVQATALLSRESPVTGMVIANAMCGF